MFSLCFKRISLFDVHDEVEYRSATVSWLDLRNAFGGVRHYYYFLFIQWQKSKWKSANIKDEFKGAITRINK